MFAGDDRFSRHHRYRELPTNGLVPLGIG